MDNHTFLFVGSPSSRESARASSGVVGNPDLAAGVLLGYTLLGVAGYILAFWSQQSCKLQAFKEAVVLSFSGKHGLLRGIQIVYCCLPTVFFMDFLNAIPAIILGTEFARSRCSSSINCDYVYIVWHLSRYFGVILHLENVLVYLHYLRIQQWGAQQRGVYISLIVLILVFVPGYVFITRWTVYVLGAFTIGLAFDIIAKSLGPSTSPSAATQKKPVLLVAMLTFFVVFLPSFILECIISSQGVIHSDYIIAYLNALFFTSFQLFLDAVLCYYILKVPLEAEEPQQEPPPQYQIWENPNVEIPANIKPMNIVSAP